MSTLTANVQYNDWKGTAAADDADQDGLSVLLVNKGLLDIDTEHLVGTKIFIGENHGGKLASTFVQCFIHKLELATFDDVSKAIRETPDPLDLKVVDLELTPEEFIVLFKRFSVVLTQEGLNLDGREYKDA